MYAILSRDFSFLITSSPIMDDGISDEFLFLNVASILSKICSIWSIDIGRFCTDFTIPDFTFSLKNFSLLLSFFITVRSVSILSYVVNLLWQFKHSRLLLVTRLSSVSLLSRTLVFSLWQYGHLILIAPCYYFLIDTIYSMFLFLEYYK